MIEENDRVSGQDLTIHRIASQSQSAEGPVISKQNRIGAA